MNVSNKELQLRTWYEFYANRNRRQNRIESLLLYKEKIMQLQSWIYTNINAIKNFITLKNNNYIRKQPFLKGMGIGWDLIMFDKSLLGISNYVENSTCIINSNLSSKIIKTSERDNVSDSNDYMSGLYIYKDYLFEVELDRNERVLKKGKCGSNLIYYLEGP